MKLDFDAIFESEDFEFEMDEWHDDYIQVSVIGSPNVDVIRLYTDGTFKLLTENYKEIS